jgi:hypothetical protein
LAYSVKFHEISGLVGNEHSTPSLVGARRVAVDAVQSGAAKRAEVRDEEGKIIFEYPGDEDF